VEVSKLAGILSAEIGANVELSKQGGFLHDIGKAMDHNRKAHMPSSARNSADDMASTRLLSTRSNRITMKWIN